MNILPHKSWHVYNKKNIEKVRKDEAKAKEEQDAKDKRAILADSEARLQVLRQRAAKNQPDDQDGNQIAKKELVTGHIHLFADAEKAASQNEEVVAEERAEKDKLDKQFTMYLDKGSKEEEAPWYAKKGQTQYSDDHLTKPYIKSKHDKDIQKRYHRPPITLESDPLAIIRSHLEKDENKSQQSTHSDREKSATHHKEDRNRHHHHRRPHKSKSSKSRSRHQTKTPSIEELRAQRREREKAERLRTQSVIYGDNPNTSHDPRQHGYNSQYNRIETDEAHQSKRSKTGRRYY